MVEIRIHKRHRPASRQGAVNTRVYEGGMENTAREESGKLSVYAMCVLMCT